MIEDEDLDKEFNKANNRFSYPSENAALRLVAWSNIQIAKSINNLCVNLKNKTKTDDIKE